MEVCGGEGEEGGAKHGVVTSVAQEETSTEKTQEMNLKSLQFEHTTTTGMSF